MTEPLAPGSVVFLGTAAFAVPSLRALVRAGEKVVRVVTQPDRPRGRGRKSLPSPVKQAALDLGLDLLQPGDVNSAEPLATLAQDSAQFLVVVAYGQILKPPLLALPACAPVNLHASLLPRHRGPAPVAWAMLASDREVGNTTMLMEAGLDSGPILHQEAQPLDPLATRGELEERLAVSGAELLVRTLADLRAARIQPRPQDERAASYSQLLTRKSRVLPWREPAPQVRARVHALAPRPGATVRVRGRLVKLLRVRELDLAGEPQVVGAVLGEAPVVGCGEGSLELLQVQPEGGRLMSGAEFARGDGIAVGDRLEPPWTDE